MVLCFPTMMPSSISVATSGSHMPTLLFSRFSSNPSVGSQENAQKQGSGEETLSLLRVPGHPTQPCALLALPAPVRGLLSPRDPPGPGAKTLVPDDSRSPPRPPSHARHRLACVQPSVAPTHLLLSTSKSVLCFWKNALAPNQMPHLPTSNPSHGPTPLCGSFGRSAFPFPLSWMSPSISKL